MTDSSSHDVDAAGRDGAYSQGHAASVLASQTWRTAENSAAYLLPHLGAGARLLDVGCGTGTITVDLSRRVAPGPVVGVDPAQDVLERARRHAAEQDVGDVTFLPLGLDDLASVPGAAEGFDVVHAHQVLLHVTDPVAAFRAMIAVTRPGGLVAARDADYGAIAIWPHDPLLDRWLEIYRSVARRWGTEPDAGRRLRAWAHAAGARDVTSSASIWCHASDEERAWWGGSWAERIVDSTIAERAVSSGIATADELRAVSDAWRRWATDPDGWFTVPHGEVLVRVPRT